MFEKIDKRKARKLYAEGKPFILVPCAMYPDSFMAMKVDSATSERLDGANFDQMLNAFSYYNCNNETGRRPAFYIET